MEDLVISFEKKNVLTFFPSNACWTIDILFAFFFHYNSLLNNDRLDHTIFYNEEYMISLIAEDA